jgi:hypothetical protein
MTGARRAALALAPALLVALVLASVAAAPRAAAQETEVFNVSASLSPRAATLGEHVQLVVTVRHSQDLLVSTGAPGRVEGIELVTPTPEEELVFDDPNSGTPDMATTTFAFTITAFLLGDLHPGDIQVSWLGSDGSTGSETVRPPILRVLPVRAEGDQELRPLKPQLGVGSPPAWWQRTELPLAVGVAALAALGIFLGRRRQPRIAPAPVLRQLRSPEDLARERLDALQGIAFVDREAYRRFYGELSLVVREYLQARFSFNAPAFTTTELRDRFEVAGVGRWQARLVAGLLERCDAAVYARYQPDPASADHDLTVAYEIVELSRPGRRETVEAVSA